MTEKSNITTNPNKIKKVLGDLNNILEEGRLPPGQKTGITHVSMGGNKGKFSFNKSQRKRLNKIVYESVSNGIELNIR